MMRTDLSRLSLVERRRIEPPRLRGIILVVALLGAVAGLAVVAGPGLTRSTALMLFLSAVLISATAQGLSTGLLAALGAFSLFHLMFVEPRYTLYVAQPEDWVMLGTFLMVAGFTGLLAGRLRDERDDAEGRAAMLGIVSRASEGFAGAEGADAVLTLLAEEVRAISGGAVMVIGEDSAGALPLRAASPADAAPDAADLQSAERALRLHRPQDAALGGGGASLLTFLPVAADPPLVLGHASIPETAPDRAYREQSIAILVHLAALLASLSHDLRTPLATILGGVTTLRDLHDSLPVAARTDLLTAVAEEAERLNLYVDKLLQMTRLQSGQGAHLDWLDPGEIAVSAVARARRARPRARIVLDLPELPMVRAEAALLEQALFNLLENASLHGKGAIRLAGGVEGETVWLSVQDEGPGLPPALAAWLEDEGLTNGPLGTGLGLPIVKGILRLHGGQIRAIDIAQGGGVQLRLPASRTQEHD